MSQGRSGNWRGTKVLCWWVQVLEERVLDCVGLKVAIQLRKVLTHCVVQEAGGDKMTEMEQVLHHPLTYICTIWYKVDRTATKC